jgi:predicted DNA-binding ribbon-helix-helix protein
VEPPRAQICDGGNAARLVADAGDRVAFFTHREREMSLIKRSMTIAGHRTSLALEPEFWGVLDECAKTRGVSLPQLIAGIDEARAATHPDRALASAARVHALNFARQR